MKMKMENGVRTLVLAETHAGERMRDSEAATMFRLWSLLTGDEGVRDLTVGHRKIR